MKSLVFIFLFFLCSFIKVQGQESFNKTYYLSNQLIKQIKKTKFISWDEATTQQQEELKKKYPKGTKIIITEKENINGEEVSIEKVIIVDEEFYSSYKFEKQEAISDIEKMRGTVLFDKNKLIMNPIFIKKRNDSIYKNKQLEQDEPDFYEFTLKNNEQIWVPFTEFTLTSLTLPLKYRFKSEKRNVKEEFTTGINLNFLLGVSYGNSEFTHRKKVGNKTNTWKITFGVLLGTGTVTLNKGNTSAAGVNAFDDDVTETKGLLTTGLGTTYSFNKINIGVFYGWDNSIGNNATLWNYNGKPWLGFGVGYSLFNL
ncbi:hypothetical protein [Gaetbulibacter jejuensis]|jgi:hypothetical protein|uniref:hypothetical protein n=1 Tax=Gaetbulibacter jejuensis TaxID=584607 RepID=UPI0030081CDD